MPRLDPLPPDHTPELQPHFDFFLGTLGFAIPAVGLSLYLHYAWFVDLDGEQVHVYRLAGGRYPAPRVLERGEDLTSSLLPGFALSYLGDAMSVLAVSWLAIQLVRLTAPRKRNSGVMSAGSWSLMKPWPASG